MANSVATDTIKDFLMGKRSLDSDVYEAIRVLYLMASSIKSEEEGAA